MASRSECILRGVQLAIVLDVIRNKKVRRSSLIISAVMLLYGCSLDWFFMTLFYNALPKIFQIYFRSSYTCDLYAEQ